MAKTRLVSVKLQGSAQNECSFMRIKFYLNWFRFLLMVAKCLGGLTFCRQVYTFIDVPYLWKSKDDEHQPKVEEWAADQPKPLFAETDGDVDIGPWPFRNVYVVVIVFILGLIHSFRLLHSLVPDPVHWMNWSMCHDFFKSKPKSFLGIVDPMQCLVNFFWKGGYIPLWSYWHRSWPKHSHNHLHFMNDIKSTPFASGSMSSHAAFAVDTAVSDVNIILHVVCVVKRTSCIRRRKSCLICYVASTPMTSGLLLQGAKHNFSSVRLCDLITVPTKDLLVRTVRCGVVVSTMCRSDSVLGIIDKVQWVWA